MRCVAIVLLSMMMPSSAPPLLHDYCSTGSNLMSPAWPSSSSSSSSDRTLIDSLLSEKKEEKESKHNQYQQSAENRTSWKHQFQNPAQWHDDRQSKKPKFKHTLINGGEHNSGWFNAELRGRESQCLEVSKVPAAKEEDNDDDDEQEGQESASGKNVKQKSVVHYLAQKNKREVLHIHNPHTLVALLKTCANQKDLDRGSRIHADVARMGLLESNELVGNMLVSMYAKCGSLSKAQEMCDMLPVRNVIAWNALIAGYVKHGHWDQALICFECMQREGHSPDAITYTCILKACGSLRATNKCQELHAQIVQSGLLEQDVVVGTALVDTYAKCGLLAKAQEVFYNLPVHNVVSWSALIAGYVQHNCGEQALDCFKQMQREGLSPDVITFTCILKACGSIRAAEKGREIHAAIVREGLLGNDIVVGTALVDMYVKCGLMGQAQDAFDRLPIRNVVSWSALISGYIQHGHEKQALDCYEQMQLEGLSPNGVTFACILKACATIGDAAKGQEVHAKIAREGSLENDITVGTALVDMYVKCGLLAKAQEVFDKLPARNVVTWSALIAGYADYGHGEQALECFSRMRSEGLSPNAVTFVCVLKACGSIRATGKGEDVHTEIIREGLLEKDITVGTALVDMYAKCGQLAKAQEVCDTLPIRDAVSYNVLIAGYAEHGHGEQALKCFEQMKCEGLPPDAVTYVCILKACGILGAADKGQEIHAEIVKEGLLERDTFVGNAVVDMYAKCGLLVQAQEVLGKLPIQNAVSWNALIAGYVQHGHGEQAIDCFERMRVEGFCPDSITYICTLKACGSIRDAKKGQKIHSEIPKGLLEDDTVIGTALVDMYSKCGLLGKAQEVLDKLPVRNVVSWNALIAGYAEHGYNEQALKCFDLMQLDGISPDAVTFVCILKTCSGVGAAEKVQDLHAVIVQSGLLGKDEVAGNALIGMYAKCGLLAKAQEVFDKLPARNITSWNTLITGYAQHGHGEQALHCFEQMHFEGLAPDAVTFASILKACGTIGAAEKGQKLHRVVAREGFLETDFVVGTSLVDMYAKCGLLMEAQEVFDNLPVRNIVSWNALIAGYSLLGNAELVFSSFARMIGEGIKPDLVTFTIVLNTCSHAGLLDKGQMHFKTMCTSYGIIPTLEHHTCMVDLYARAGHLDKAMAIIRNMPFSDNITVWLTVLGACQKWGDMKLGKLAFEQTVLLDGSDAAAYVCMSNIYADVAS